MQQEKAFIFFLSMHLECGVFLATTSDFALDFKFSIINNASGSLVVHFGVDRGNSLSPPGHKSGRKPCQEYEQGVATCLHKLAIAKRLILQQFSAAACPHRHAANDRSGMVLK